MSEIIGNKFQSDIKGMEGEGGFVSLLFGHLSRMSFAINNPEAQNKDSIVYYNALFIIGHIPNKEKRKEYKKLLLQNIEDYKKAGKSNDAAVTTASVEIVGEVIDHIDELIGLEKQSKIAIEFSCGDCQYFLRCQEEDSKEKIVVGA